MCFLAAALDSKAKREEVESMLHMNSSEQGGTSMLKVT